MSTEQVTQVETFKLPRPFILKDSDVKKPDFEPVNTIVEASKIMVYSGIFLGGMHFRRLLQHRMGAARPGQQRYLALFELSPRHFISIPLALGTYSFLSNSLYNLDEERTSGNEIISASAAVLVATIFKKSMALNQKIGTALGIAAVLGLFKWAGGLVDTYNTSFTHMSQTGQVHNQESNKSLDEEFANGTYKKQGFWELLYRKPLSETIEDRSNLFKSNNDKNPLTFSGCVIPAIINPLPNKNPELTPANDFATVKWPLCIKILPKYGKAPYDQAPAAITKVLKKPIFSLKNVNDGSICF